LPFAPKAVRALRNVDRLVAERVRTATEALRDEPSPVTCCRPGRVRVLCIWTVLALAAAAYLLERPDA
jgi:hypothetical protein